MLNASSKFRDLGMKNLKFREPDISERDKLVQEALKELMRSYGGYLPAIPSTVLRGRVLKDPLFQHDGQMDLYVFQGGRTGAWAVVIEGTASQAREAGQTLLKSMVPKTKLRHVYPDSMLHVIWIDGGRYGIVDVKPLPEKKKKRGPTISDLKHELVLKAKSTFGRGAQVSGNKSKGWKLHVKPTKKSDTYRAFSFHFTDFDEANEKLDKVIAKYERLKKDSSLQQKGKPMSNLKNELIKLGYQKPELRAHLRPVIATLEGKEASGFVIGPGGLEEPKKIHVQPNTVYYYGASSSPSKVLTNHVDDDSVSFYQFSYGKAPRLTREQRWVFEDLAHNGTKTWVSTYGRYYPEEARNMKRLLQGRPVPEAQVDINSYIRGEERITILVEAVDPDMDYYGKAKSYGVVGNWDPDAGTIEIETERKNLEDVRRNPAFTIIKVKG